MGKYLYNYKKKQRKEGSFRVLYLIILALDEERHSILIKLEHIPLPLSFLPKSPQKIGFQPHNRNDVLHTMRHA